MRTLIPVDSCRVLVVCAAALGLVACGQQEQPVTEEPAAQAPAEAAPEVSVKVPVTTTSEEARELFMTGRDLFDNLRFVDAQSYFQQAIEKDPAFGMAYVLLAATAQSPTEFQAASKQAEQVADQVSPGERLMIQALAAAARNDQSAQLDYLKQLVAMHPGDERTHFQLANYHIGVQENEAAIEHFGHATQINPEYANAFNSLGYALRANGQLGEAEAAFKQYRDLIPDEANPYDSYAELLLEMGRYDESTENYRAALERNPNFAASYAGISVGQSLKGDTEAALAAAAEMLTSARNNGEKRTAMFREATSHLFAGNRDAAIAALQKSLALSEEEGNDSAMATTHQYLGDIMLDAGEPSKAMEHYQTALEHSRQADINEANKAQAERTHLFKSALASMVADDVEAAESRVAEFTAQAEAQGTALERRRIHELAGFLALLKEDPATAAAELSQADQTNPVVLYWSAVVHRDAGDAEAAAKLAAKAANHNPLSPLLPLVRAEALELISSLEEAA